MPNAELLTSRSQLLRMRRALLAALGWLAFLLLCWLAFTLGHLSISEPGMWLLSIVQVGGAAVFVGLIWSHLNLKFRDPSLALMQMLWAIVVIFTTAYFAAQLRSLFLSMLLLVVMFGAFRLERRGFVLIVGFSLLCYALLLGLLHYQATPLDAGLESIHALGFVILLLGVSLLGLELAQMRQTLQLRNRDLRKALEQIQQLAITDELTGLYNERFARELLAQQQALADRGDYGFTLCLIQLEGLHHCYAEHASEAVSVLLNTLAQLLREELREVDFVARHRSDEFLLILSRVDEMSALHLADRLRQRIDQLIAEQAKPLTCAIGLACYQPDSSWQLTLQAAEEALQQAKRSGQTYLL